MKQVYIVEDGNGRKKIGITGNLKQRISQLNSSNPSGIISIMTSDFLENAREIEKLLHEANKKHKISGEWFSNVTNFCDIEFPHLFMRATENSVILFQDFCTAVAVDKQITGQTMRVLFFLISKTEPENFIRIKQVEITKQLEMQKSEVSRSMKLLVDKEIILKIKEGTTTVYKLNPNYGWKGKVENRKEAQIKMEEDKIIDFQEARESRDISGISADEVPY